jgi:hypothetical protein
VKTLHKDAVQDLTRVRLKLLLFYWLDKEGKSKENKILKKCANPLKYFG